MGSALFGSSPKATFSTQPTISPGQQQLLDLLTNTLTGGGAGSFSSSSALGGTSLASLEAQAMNVGTGVTGTQSGINQDTTGALTRALNYQPPSVSAGSVTAPQIDSTEAFRRGVVEPMTDDFLQRTLPSIAGKFGGSAGGAYGSGSAAARGQAATDLERTLGQQGAQFAYTSAAANQSAALQAALANQGAGLTADISNQTASNNAIKDILAAIGIAPTAATLPQTELGANIGLSSATFAPYQQMLADLIAGGTARTQETLGVGQAGSSGILGGLLGGLGSFAGSSGGSSLIASLFSDRRLKEDVEEVGSVAGFPLYKFRYKGMPERRLGLMAQDVEKRLPHAVGESGGYKTVDYAAVLADVLKEAA